MSGSTLVLVTGITGFLGSHVVDQLLRDGYRVRGTARSAKVSLAQEGYAAYGSQYEVVAIDDLVRGDFTEALRGDGFLPSREVTTHVVEQAAIEGSLNVFRQAEQAGVRKFAYASSIVTVRSISMRDLNTSTPISPYSDQGKPPFFPRSIVPNSTCEEWLDVSKEDALEDPFFVYAVEKTEAERAVWDFVDQHPHIEMLAVNPPFFYGPFAPGFRNPEAKIAVLSTNVLIYNLIRLDGPPLPGVFIDVRDVARGLINALKAPPSSRVGRKRILMSGEWFSAKDAIEYLEQMRPDLKDRLSEPGRRVPPVPKSLIDNKRATEILGLEFHGWKQTLLEAVDDLLRLEQEWRAKGLTPS
ncbi:hypothetical protein NLI96_g10512 [Meripilus lineatus]|uniref:NAD-dependent epimerase/dehydratase domain-containing protein n=1 Tax=Meripilus lineatus TaxID=2056292 RepID=A0AAD5UTM1_9APHY|nr:hypothetical protein NLI96_g10512 [Physisporinus lineatus]